MGLEALQAGAEVPGRLGPVMWNWEDSATWGRLPPGWLYLKLALKTQMGGRLVDVFGGFSVEMFLGRVFFDPKFRKTWWFSLRCSYGIEMVI